MKLSDLLHKDFIIAELKSTAKEDVINELIDVFNNDSRVIDLKKVRDAVLDSEKIMSTGVGKGFAIPHGKTGAVNEILAALREGYTVALINIKPLKDKDLVELKRAVSKLKKTCEAIEGDIAGFGEDWIVVTPSFAQIYRGMGGEDLQPSPEQ